MNEDNLELFKEALVEGIDRRIQRYIDACDEEIVFSQKHLEAMESIINMTKTVAFTGYRLEKMPFPEDENDERYLSFRKKLFIVISRLSELGYTRYISGIAQGFDTWCAEDVLALDEWLECAIPFPEQAINWNSAAQKRRNEIIAQCNKQTIISPTYKKGCYYERNRYMVDNADVIVCCYTGNKNGGTAYTVNYALQEKKVVVQINPKNNEITVLSDRKIKL